MALGIDTLVLIVLGLICLAVMVYLIISIIQTPSIDCNKCKADFTQFCNICYSSKCSYYKVETKLCECLSKCGVQCDSSKDQTCNDLKLQCQTTGVNFVDYC